MNRAARIAFRSRLGRCYELAGKYVMDAHMRGEECALVHGSIQGLGFPRIKHAWVELPDGQVHDPVADTTMALDEHRAFYSAEVDCRYTYEDMARNACRSQHWGPWAESSACTRLNTKGREL